MKPINGAKLRAWRHTQRRSIESMAHELGISYATWQKWEKGKRKEGILPVSYQALVKLGYSE